MTDIEWGPAIAVDGKRPEFVRDNDLVLGRYSERTEDDDECWATGKASWRDFNQLDAIRLPADHPHYRQPTAIPEGMKAWHGGDKAPADWNGKEVLMRNGSMIDPKGAWDAFTWQHTSWGDPNRMPVFDIIAYTPQADTKPDLTEDGVRDLDAARHHDAVVWDRMEALVRKLSATRYYSNEDQAEARAIVALLSEPVDPDLIEAREIVAKGFERRYRDVGSETYGPERARAGNYDDTVVADCLAAIKRGRALALAGEKEA